MSYMDKVPDWLVSKEPTVTLPQDIDRGVFPMANPKSNRQLTRELMNQTFDNMLEHVLAEVSSGRTIKSLLDEDYREPDYQHFLGWLRKDPGRWARYQDAQEISAEMDTARMVEEAYGLESNNDVQRSTLIVNTLKFKVQSYNRRRYGDTKQVDQAVTININEAIDAARERSGVTIEGRVVNE